MRKKTMTKAVAAGMVLMSGALTVNATEPASITARSVTDVMNDSKSSAYEDAVKNMKDAHKKADEAKEKQDLAKEEVDKAQSDIDDAKNDLEQIINDTKEEERVAGDVFEHVVSDAKEDLDEADLDKDAADSNVSVAEKDASDKAETLANAKTRLVRAKKDLDDKKEETGNITDQDVKDARDLADQAKSELDKAEKDASSAEDTVQDAENKESAAKAEVDKTKARKEQAENDLEDARKLIDNTKDSLDDAQNKFDEAVRKVGEDAYKKAEKDLDDAKSEQKNAKDMVTGLDKVLADDKTEINELKVQIAESEKALAEKNETLKNAEDSVADKDQNVMDIQNQLNTEKSHMDELKRERTLLEENLKDAKDAYEDAKNKKQNNEKDLKQSLLDAGGTALAAKDAADAEVSEVQAAADKAQEDLDNAKETLADGSYGFFEWMGSTEITDYDEYSYRVKSSAIDALENPFYGNYEGNFNTEGRGQSYDATSFENMLKALDYIDTCNELRKGEGLNELKVSLTLMGVAQSNANFISYHFEHAGGMGGENIANNSGEEDPFNAWYYIEKENPYYFGTDGHYKNIINPSYDSTGFAIRIKNGAYYYSQIFGSSTDSYTTAELRTLIQQYNEHIIDEPTGILDTALKELEDVRATQTEAAELLNRIVSELNDLGADTDPVKSGTADETTPAVTLLKNAKSEYENAQMIKTEYEASKTALSEAKSLYDSAVENAAKTQDEILALEAVIAQDEAALEDAKTEKQKAESDYQSVKADHDNVETALNDLTTALSDKEKELSDDEAALDTAKSKLAEADEKVANAKEKLNAFGSEVEEAKAALDEAKNTYADAVADKEAKENILKDKETAYENALSVYEDAVLSKKSAVDAYNEAVTTVNEKKAVYEQLQEAYETKMNLLSTVKDAEQKVADAENAVTQVQKSYDAAAETLQDKKSAAEAAAAAYEQAKAVYEKAQNMELPTYEEALEAYKSGTIMIQDEDFTYLNSYLEKVIKAYARQEEAAENYEKALTVKAAADKKYDEASKGYMKALADLSFAQDEYHALNPFTDVHEEAYYYDAVLWAVGNKITNGRTETTFEPQADCTRAQVVMFLWNTAGCPEPASTKNPFSDVSKESRFYKAILWAYEEGITKGYRNGTFRPNDSVKRAEYVTMQYRSSGEPEVKTTVNPFADVTQEAFQGFYDAVLWAYENGITEGKDASHFEPNESCSRANVVAFLYRERA